MAPQFRRALVRPPGPRFADGLTSQSGPPPSLPLALAQHAAYCATLAACGLTVEKAPPANEFPDACFVEDPAVLGPGLAVLARPGADSRRDEAALLRGWIAANFPDHDAIAPPGTLEGGDVLACDEEWFIGLSARTNRAGALQLAARLRLSGCRVALVELPPPLLHLKSAVSYLGDRTLLTAPPLAGHAAWRGFREIELPAEEAYAANALFLNGAVLLAAGYPRTLALLLQAGGYRLLPLDVSEFARMDGGLSCLSLRY